MRRAISALLLAGAFLLAGCGGIEQSGVEPGEGPAVTDEPMHGPIDGEPGDEMSEVPSPLQDNAKFGENMSTATASKSK